jgi:hypothetical protein
MVVGHMWTMQHGLNIFVSYLQAKVQHHLYPNFPTPAPTPKVVLANPINMVTPSTNPTPCAKYWIGN